MTMTNWAKREVEIACARERRDKNPDEWDYGCACYKSAIFMGVLNNGMSILGIDANWQKAVKGLVLLAAVVIDVMSKKRVSN